MAFAPGATSAAQLSTASIVPVQDTIPSKSTEELKSLLADQVQAVVDAGHLRPGLHSTGIFDLRSRRDCGADLVDYWHHPADLTYTLLRALPHLPPGLQAQTEAYLQSEFSTFPAYQYNHIGWKDGNARAVFDVPPEVQAKLQTHLPESVITNFEGWNFAPHAFYALWKYAQRFGDAPVIYNLSKDKLDFPPKASDAYLLDMPHVHNAYIAGYIGYLELESLAGVPQNGAISAELNRLLQLRADNFSKDVPDSYFQSVQTNYCRALIVSRNFMYLVPELAQFLYDDLGARPKVQEALSEYEYLAPYWFVSKYEATFAEGILNHLFDYHSIFQARAQFLQESQQELVKYLDIPAFPTGDLFYIQNLIAAIEAENN